MTPNPGLKHEEVFGPYLTDDHLVRQAVPAAGWLTDYVAWAGPCTEAPKIYHLGAGLACLATAIGRRAKVTGVGPWPLCGNLFVGIIGAQGLTRKSTALAFARQVLTQNFSAELYSGDTTAEALQKQVLADSPDRLLLIDEVARLLGRDYRSGMGPLLAQLYDCPEELTVNRVGDERKKGDERPPILEPTVSILAASTLSWLKGAIGDGDVTGGILSRWLWLVGNATGQLLPRPPRPDETIRDTLAGRLVNYRDSLDRTPRLLSMDPAGGSWDRLYEEYHRKANGEADGDTFGGFLGRLSGNILPKLALLYTLSANPQATAIAPEVFDHVRPLGELLQRGLRHVIEGLASNDYDRAVQRTADFIRKHPEGITKRQISREGPAACRHSKKRRDEYLETLQAGDFITIDGELVTPTAYLLERSSI